MHFKTHKAGRWLLALSLTSVLLLSACGPSNADATPTQSVEEIYTAAYQTLIAQQATTVALTPPTSTPVPSTPTPLPVPSSPPATVPTFAFANPTKSGGGGASVCDNSAFVSDVTIPDNTTIDPGKKFTKTWKLLNNGSCTWGAGYKLAFDSGDQMGGATTAITVPVPSGSVADISVAMTAPTTNGTYKGIWRMQNASSQPFGALPYVIIKVGAGGTATAGPSPTPGEGDVTISGSLGAVEVTLDFSGASTTPTVSYSGSDYSFTVPSGWSGTLIPSKGACGKWTFDPSSKTFTNVTADKTFDFRAVSGDGCTPTPKP
jgi:hypothetical protein